MRLVGYELGKVLKNKRCLQLLLFLILIYSIIFYQKEQMANDYSPKQYVDLYTEIQNQTPEQAVDSLKKELEKMQVYRELYDGLTTEHIKVRYRDSVEDYKKSFEEEKSHYAAGDFSKRIYLLETVQKEVQNIIEYPEYLAYIRTQKQKNSDISIFQKEETDYAYRNVEKTIQDFESVTEYKINSIDNARGVIASAGDFSMTICLLLMGFILCYFIYGYEKQRQVVMLLKANYYGQKELARAKILAFVILISSLTVLLQVINLAESAWIYGLGDLSRRIQTVPEFVSCPWNWSVALFLLVQLVLRICIHIVIIIGCFAAFCKVKNPVFVYAGVIALYAGEWLIYQKIPGNSLFAFLKYCNLYYFTETPTIAGFYLNVNIAQYPISILILFASVVLIGMVAAVFLSVHWFVKKNSHHTKRLAPKFSYHPNVSHGIVRYECYKLFIKQGAILFCVLLAFIQYFYIKNYIPSLTIDDVRYEMLVDEFRGKAGEEKGAELQTKIQQYESDEQEWMELEARFNESGKGLTDEENKRRNELAKQTQDLSILKKIDRRNTELSQLQKSAELMFEREYDLLTLNRYADLEKALKSILFLLIGMTGFLAMDYETGVVVLQNTCESGRKKLNRMKWLTASGYIFIIFLLSYLPDFYLTYHFFGLNQLSAPIYSLSQFSECPIAISIGTYLVLKSLIQLGGLYIIFGIDWWLTKKLKRGVFSLVIMIGLFVLPLLYLLQ